MGKPDKYRSSSRDRSRGRDESPGRESYHSRAKSRDEGRSEKKHKEKKYGYGDDEDAEKERKKREKKEKKERERRGGEGYLGDGARSGGHGSSRPQSRERERGFPGEHGPGRYQESEGWGERPNVQTYGHPGYGAQPGYGTQPGYGGQPQPYQPPPPQGAYDQGAYGGGQGTYGFQSTPPPPVQYQPPPTYQQPGAYGGPYQTGPPPPPAGYGESYNQTYPPGPPPSQGYQSGHEYHHQGQSAGYPPQVQYVPEQGPYSQGYHPQPGPPPGTPGYHSPLPNPPYGPPSGPGYGAYGPVGTYSIPPVVVAGGVATGHYSPHHHSALQQQHQYQETNQYGTPICTASASSVQPITLLNPANPNVKPGFSTSALNTFTTGLNSALHTYARTLFPATSTHKPAAVTGDSGAPAQITEHRFDSFSPVRGGNDAKWYVDGKDYMYAVSIALERAQKSIWIMDCMV